MARFDALADFLEDGGLELPPIPSRDHPEGKVYVVKSPDAETGLRLQAMGEVAVKAAAGVELDEHDAERLKLNDDQEANLMDAVLGETKAEMIADGVPWVALQRVNRFAFVYFALGEDAATGMLDRNTGKAQPQNRTQRRAAAKLK